ncbi:hypothetical protein Ancab_013746 [Ancistrocladus abbreviatus]
MAHMMKKQASLSSPTSPSLGLHRDSRVISKIQPKIRVIHIFAPEIIKTDVANFRELVQRLTGKPSENGGSGGSKVARARKSSTREDQPSSNAAVHEKTTVSKMVHHHHQGDHHHHHHHQALWRDECSGGFLNAFSDVDCFMQEIGVGVGEFPSFVSSEGNAFGETQLSYRG